MKMVTARLGWTFASFFLALWAGTAAATIPPCPAQNCLVLMCVGASFSTLFWGIGTGIAFDEHI